MHVPADAVSANRQAAAARDNLKPLGPTRFPRAGQRALQGPVAGPSLNARARGFNRDDRAYRWQHVPLGGS